jgi:hypothetical protein
MSTPISLGSASKVVRSFAIDHVDDAFHANPVSVACTDDTIYVYDYGNKAIKAYSHYGEFKYRFPARLVFESVKWGHWNNASAHHIAPNEDGSVIFTAGEARLIQCHVSRAHYENDIVVYDTNGQVIQSWPANGNALALAYYPDHLLAVVQKHTSDHFLPYYLVDYSPTGEERFAHKFTQIPGGHVSDMDAHTNGDMFVIGGYVGSSMAQYTAIGEFVRWINAPFFSPSVEKSCAAGKDSLVYSYEYGLSTSGIPFLYAGIDTKNLSLPNARYGYANIPVARHEANVILANLALHHDTGFVIVTTGTRLDIGLTEHARKVFILDLGLPKDDDDEDGDDDDDEDDCDGVDDCTLFYKGRQREKLGCAYDPLTGYLYVVNEEALTIYLYRYLLPDKEPQIRVQISTTDTDAIKPGVAVHPSGRVEVVYELPKESGVVVTRISDLHGAASSWSTV